MNIDTHEFQAITATVAELRHDVVALRERVEQATAVEQVLRRASHGAEYAEMLNRARKGRHARPGRHLRVVR